MAAKDILLENSLFSLWIGMVKGRGNCAIVPISLAFHSFLGDAYSEWSFLATDAESIVNDVDNVYVGMPNFPSL